MLPKCVHKLCSWGYIFHCMYSIFAIMYMYVCTTVKCDPLHGDVTFGHFRIRVRLAAAMIERKALIVSLLTNASDYSSETTISVRYKHIELSMQGVVTCVGEQRYV